MSLTALLLLHALFAATTAAPLPATTATSSTYHARKAACEAQRELICNVAPTTGHSTAGSVRFSPHWAVGPRGYHVCFVRVKAEVTGLSPGKHGFHIHTYGDLSEGDGTSTGGHFTNPAGEVVPHGFRRSAVRHWGDLSNIDAVAGGPAVYDRLDGVIRLEGIVGRGVTVHADADKGPAYQPTGGAGARVGYCVIGVANPDL